MFWKRRVAVFTEGRQSSSTGPPSPSPAMWRWAPKALQRAFRFAQEGRWNGAVLVYEAVQIWILLGCSSELMVRVAPNARCGLIQMYKSSRYAQSLAPPSSVRWVSEDAPRHGVDRCRQNAVFMECRRYILYGVWCTCTGSGPLPL